MVKLNDYVVVQKRHINVNPSLPGPVGVEEASKGGHHTHSHHSHHQGGNLVFIVDDDSADVETDVNPDCDDDGDYDENRIKIS